VALVAKPSDWRKSVAKNTADFFERLQSPEVKTLVQSANDRYLHWHEFMHRPLPEGLTHEMAWAFIKVTRQFQLRPIGLVSTSKSPFSYWLPDSVLRELHFVDQNATGQILVEEPVLSSTDRDRYVINSLMEEAIASSILEGAATTRKKAKEMLREGRKPKSRSDQMIVNNYRVMRRLKEIVAKSLSPEIVVELQAELTRDTMDDNGASGRYRRADEDVRVVDMMDGEALHVPPPAGELHSRMERLCDFANNESQETFFHPVAKAIVLHFWLAYDHPFVDGNGRTARALFYWYLLKRGYWMMEYLPVSRIYLKAPAKYKRAFLYAETDEEDLTYFIHFNARVLRLAIDDLRRYIARRQQELQETTTLLKRVKGLNHRQRDLLRHAVSHEAGDYTIYRHMRLHDVVYQTARSDLLGLAKRGFLTMDRRGGTLHFAPHNKLRQRLKLT
jgi:Fic family protein